MNLICGVVLASAALVPAEFGLNKRTSLLLGRDWGIVSLAEAAVAPGALRHGVSRSHFAFALTKMGNSPFT